ncbi:MAG TPA: nuclear transport factor 2 family protein [Mycobacteriales bacterium]|nr:nuclear transport factor 2 family protein [Mycobacteriales bacterium]
MAPNEVEQAFHRILTTGITDENWLGWTELLTEDVLYVERIFGTMRGRASVRAWITELMAARADVHGVLNWYVVKGDRVVFDMTNRIYHPDPSQPPIDFAGLTVLQYAGDGLFGYEEDYWDQKGSEVAYREFLGAVKRCGGKGLDGGRVERLEAERKAHNHAVLAAGG